MVGRDRLELFNDFGEFAEDDGDVLFRVGSAEGQTDRRPGDLRGNSNRQEDVGDLL
jgi:hypothetical protein